MIVIFSLILIKPITNQNSLLLKMSHGLLFGLYMFISLINRLELKNDGVGIDSDSVCQLTCSPTISFLFSMYDRFYKKIQSFWNRLVYSRSDNLSSAAN